MRQVFITLLSISEAMKRYRILSVAVGWYLALHLVSAPANLREELSVLKIHQHQINRAWLHGRMRCHQFVCLDVPVSASLLHLPFEM
jgi:hypothetical protein